MYRQELEGDNIFVIPGFLSEADCEQLIAQSEQHGYGDAPLWTGFGFVVDRTVRNNARVMVDDPALAAALWIRARPLIPARFGRWEAVGLNERLRYYRYDVHERFAPHYDGAFQRDDIEQSKLTFMVYLNEGFDGGETIFHKPGCMITVRPERGKALVFAHRQLHEGAAVRRGRKYVLRTDVMYRKVNPSAAAEAVPSETCSLA